MIMGYDETWESPIQGLGEEELQRREARAHRILKRRYGQLLLACENLILDANARPGAYLYADLGPIRTIIAAIIIEEEAQ